MFHSYIGGIFRSLKCYPIQIGGMPDHIHILVEIPPSSSVSEIVRNVKVSSCKWVVDAIPQMKVFQRQNGYGAFSVNSLNKGSVIKYIKNQKKHHEKVGFRDEFTQILKLSGTEYNEKYLWR